MNAAFTNSRIRKPFFTLTHFKNASYTTLSFSRSVSPFIVLSFAFCVSLFMKLSFLRGMFVVLFQSFRAITNVFFVHIYCSSYCCIASLILLHCFRSSFVLTCMLCRCFCVHRLSFASTASRSLPPSCHLGNVSLHTQDWLYFLNLF